MLTTTLQSRSNPLRDTITKAYRMDETECLDQLIPEATLAGVRLAHISNVAKELVIETREYKKKQGK